VHSQTGYSSSNIGNIVFDIGFILVNSVAIVPKLFAAVPPTMLGVDSL